MKEEIKKALNRFENAVIAYWQLDGQEHPSYRKLREADNKVRETRETLIRLIDNEA